MSFRSHLNVATFLSYDTTMVSVQQFIVILACSVLVVRTAQQLSYQEPARAHTHALPRSVRESSSSVDESVAIDTPVQRMPDMTVFALTYNRAPSLQRLLESLARASYEGDRIDLRIMIDFNNETMPNFPDVVSAAEMFQWPHGEKFINKQTKKTFCSGQWIDSWKPAPDDTSLAGFFEDDVEVSKLWYKWVKHAHAAYKDQDDVFGYCLNRVSWNATANGRDLLNGGPADKDSVNFMYKFFGTWGTVLKGKQLSQFRTWYHDKGGKNLEPEIPGLILVNEWVDKYVDMADLTFVYAKVRGRNYALANNHKDPGMNYAKKRHVDSALIVDEYDGLYEFPSPPIRLGWNGLPL